MHAARLAFLVTLSNGTAVVWGNISERGTVLEKTGYGVEHVSSTHYAFAVTWSDGSVTTFGDPERGGNSERVQDRLTSVRMVWSNNAAFAAVTSHRNIVCWGEPKCGGRMETVPAGGIVDVISTGGSFVALTENGEVRSWGAASLPGQPYLEIPPNVELIRATSGAFAALHKNGTVTIMGQPRGGREHRPRAKRADCNAMDCCQLNYFLCWKGRPRNSILGIPYGNPHSMLLPGRRTRTS